MTKQEHVAIATVLFDSKPTEDGPTYATWNRIVNLLAKELEKAKNFDKQKFLAHCLKKA